MTHIRPPATGDTMKKQDPVSFGRSRISGKTHGAFLEFEHV